MRVSLFVILILSWTFFAIYNLVLIVGALAGFYPLTIFTGIYYARISDVYLRTLLGIPGFIMGILATFFTDSRIWGIVNALIASALVVVEINFSIVASYAMARQFSEILSIFTMTKPVFVASFLGALIKRSKKVGGEGFSFS